MYLIQIIILLVVEIIFLAPDITSGIEIVSTTTERDINKDNRCQQEIMRTFGNTLQEQQNFWISFYNNSYELQSQKQLQQTRKEIVDLFDKKLEEANVESGKRQKELIEIINKQNDLLQHFQKKMEEITDKFTSIQEKVLKPLEEKIEKLTPILEKVELEKKKLPKNCQEILKRGNTSSGVYTIQPTSQSPSFEVRCDMDTRGGGWTYVLNRFDGSQDFYLNWQQYKKGFGNLAGEFWLGLQHLYELTGSQNNHLLIELVDWNNKHFYAIYNKFGIGSEKEGYPLEVLDGYSGDAGDSLWFHKNSKFSTYDRDHGLNHATYYHGAWWYKNGDCYSNLAGTYYNTAKYDSKGITWWSAKRYESLRKASMLVRPIDNWCF